MIVDSKSKIESGNYLKLLANLASKDIHYGTKSCLHSDPYKQKLYVNVLFYVISKLGTTNIILLLFWPFSHKYHLSNSD